MGFKKPSEKKAPLKKANVHAQAEKLSNELADKRYGDAPTASTDDEVIRRSISMPKSLIKRIDHHILQNKYRDEEPTNVSALFRQLVEKYLDEKGA